MIKYSLLLAVSAVLVSCTTVVEEPETTTVTRESRSTVYPLSGTATQTTTTIER